MNTCVSTTWVRSLTSCHTHSITCLLRRTNRICRSYVIRCISKQMLDTFPLDASALHILERFLKYNFASVEVKFAYNEMHRS